MNEQSDGCILYDTFSCDTHGEVIITPRFRPMAVSITLETLNGPGVLARRLLPVGIKPLTLCANLCPAAVDEEQHFTEASELDQ